MIDELYDFLAERPDGADAEALLAQVFADRGTDPAFGRAFLDALLADDPRFVAHDEGSRWRLADTHLLDEPLGRAPFVVVDLETTGQRPEEAGMTEIGAVRLLGTEVVERFETLVNPGKPIPPYVATLTGISEAMVASAPPVEDVIPAFARFAAGAVVVAHNAAFDVSLLDFASRRVLGRPLGLPSLCTFKLARRLLPHVTRASLDGLAEHFEIARHSRHRALADAELTADVLVRLMRLLDAEGTKTVNALLSAQEDPAAPRQLRISIPRARFEALPAAPGVFWLTDRAGETLFVGQAENLRARMIAYFAGRAHLSNRQFEMLSSTADIGFRRADNALERAMVEAEEICRRGPLLNRPDKHLPRGSFVKLQRRGRFPRVLVASRIAGDGALYVGPMKSRTFADDAAAVVARTFRLRTCPGAIHPAPAFEPCGLGPSGACSSPCNAAVSAGAYRAQVEEAERALARDPGALRTAASRARGEQRQRSEDVLRCEDRPREDRPRVDSAREGDVDRTRDGAVIGRLAKLHRRRHWLVNAQSYIAAFPATGGGLWVAIVLEGFCRHLECVTDAAQLEAALSAAAHRNGGRVGAFEADASTILAHWIRRTEGENELAVLDLDAADLDASLEIARRELAPLVV